MIARDLFTELFGSGRGVPGRETITSPLAAASAALTAILLGRTPLPVGLTLLTGESGDGKTVTATFLATKLAENGVKAAYLSCTGADDVYALLQAQTSKISVSAAGTLFVSVDGVDDAAAVRYAKRVSDDGTVKVIIIDGLDFRFQLGLRAWERLSALSTLARTNNVAVLATCTSAIGNSTSRAAADSRALAQIVLRVRGVGGGPNNIVPYASFNVSNRESGGSARLRLDGASSVISLAW